MLLHVAKAIDSVLIKGSVFLEWLQCYSISMSSIWKLPFAYTANLCVHMCTMGISQRQCLLTTALRAHAYTCFESNL